MPLAFLITLFLFVLPNEKETLNQAFEKIAVTGIKSNEIIMNAQKISFAKDGSIYLTDKIYCRINIYNCNLNKIKSIGKKGKSLGDFKAPSQITSNGKFIVVSDFASSRVQVFNSTFKPLYLFFTEGPIFDMAFDKNGFLLIGVYTALKNRTLFKYDVSGNIKSIINLRNTYGDPFRDIYKFTVLPNGFIAITYLIQNVIEILDNNYKYVRTITIDDLPSSPEIKKLGNGLVVPKDNLIQSVSSDYKSRIYVLASHYVEKIKQEVFVYDIDGNLLKRFLLPEPADEIFINGKSEIFLIEKNRTILKKYKSKV